jgi:TDG/mug DNA glycosylase family protein
MDRKTVDVYERRASEWASARPARHPERARALGGDAIAGLRRVDLGCGHGPYLDYLGEPVVGIDASRALLSLARDEHPGALLVRGDLSALPFRDGSLGAGWARNSYLHLPEADLPLALARLHWALAPEAPVAISMLGTNAPTRTVDDFPGRMFSHPSAGRLGDLMTGAGFNDVVIDTGEVLWAKARRARSLPDSVGPDMRVLVCGLNPSLVAADAGHGFAGATNRFWPAAMAAGLVSRPRDPLHALRVDGVGMTDFVKRATPRASEVTKDEFREGGLRVHRLVAWLEPRVVLVVGLAGWRAAVNPKAVPGWQPGNTAAPVYVMPSTSGLNARVRVDELVAHMRAALEG